jgi:hypothetical protein
MEVVMKRLMIVLVVLLVGAFTPVRAQQYPFWELLLHYYGGTTDQTPVPSMKMGNHMQVSVKGAAQPGDQQRAKDILVGARNAINHYSDVNTALDDGYKPFHPTGRMGEEVHYTNNRYGREDRVHMNYEHPTSLLYKRTPEGMKAVGVMYTAPQNATAEQLNAILPLSVGVWHRHVDFCGAPRNLPLDEQFGPNAKFGILGSIHTEDACQQAHGLWIPVVFGWMTHVYPNAPDPNEVCGGLQMHMESNAPDEPMKM